MQFGITTNAKEHVVMHYVCSGICRQTNRCASHYINEMDLRYIISEYIRIISKRIIKDEEGFAEELRQKWIREQKNCPKEAQRTLSEAQKRLDELDRVISGLYENFTSGLLPERQYRLLLEKYDHEQQEIEGKIGALEVAAKEEKGSQINIEKFLALIKKYKEPGEITREMAFELIDKIVVYHAEGKLPNRTQKIEVYFTFIGKFDLVYTDEELAEIRMKEDAQIEEKKRREQIKRQKYYQKKKQAHRDANEGHLHPQKPCACCGKLFWPNRSYSLYCSKECHRIVDAKRHHQIKIKKRGPVADRICQICGKTFHPENPNQKMCSVECSKIRRKNKRREYYVYDRDNRDKDPKAEERMVKSLEASRICKAKKRERERMMKNGYVQEDSKVDNKIIAFSADCGADDPAVDWDHCSKSV